MIYNALVTTIKGRKYNQDELLNNMDFYLLRSRITQTQYEALERLMLEYPTNY